jgi:broad specificity phosphatase PhoE
MSMPEHAVGVGQRGAMAVRVALVALGRVRPDLDAHPGGAPSPARRTVPVIQKPPPPMRSTIGAPGPIVVGPAPHRRRGGQQAPHRLTPRTTDALREIDHGRWEGLTRQEVERGFPEEYAGWEADPFTFAPEGGEAGIHVLARALPVLREIVARHADASVLVVSHKATIRLLISSLLGFDARGYRDRLDQHPCCLNIIDFRDTVRARLMLFNDVSHYEGLPERMLAAHLSKWWDAPRR